MEAPPSAAGLKAAVQGIPRWRNTLNRVFSPILATTPHPSRTVSNSATSVAGGEPQNTAAAKRATATLESESGFAAPAAGDGRAGEAVPADEPDAPSLLHFLSRELNWGVARTWRSRGAPAGSAVGFLRVPLMLEPFLAFGTALCTDVFLFHFTLLPLRCLMGLVYAVAALLALVVPHAGLRAWAWGGPGGAPRFTRAHAYDWLKVSIVCAATLALLCVPVSRVYHYIRGEAFIKMYVIFNILEIFDRLACSLGADLLDAMYTTTRDHLSLPGWLIPAWWRGSAAGDSAAAAAGGGKGSSGGSRGGSGGGAAAASLSSGAAILRLLLHYSLAVAYVSLHALILFVQIVCLNVAINSRSNGLLTLLVSNNFVELKASVFKRFEPENLFQVSCADCVERFQLLLFLGLIAMQETASASSALSLLPSMAVILLSEVCVDYAKHAFIAKFNSLSPALYRGFGAILAHDLVALKGRQASSLDPTHMLVKRMGLATLPLTVLALRMALLRIAPSLVVSVTGMGGGSSSSDTGSGGGGAVGDVAGRWDDGHGLDLLDELGGAEGAGTPLGDVSGEGEPVGPSALQSLPDISACVLMVAVALAAKLLLSLSLLSRSTRIMLRAREGLQLATGTGKGGSSGSEGENCGSGGEKGGSTESSSGGGDERSGSEATAGGPGPGGATAAPVGAYPRGQRGARTALPAADVAAGDGLRGGSDATAGGPAEERRRPGAAGGSEGTASSSSASGESAAGVVFAAGLPRSSALPSDAGAGAHGALRAGAATSTAASGLPPRPWGSTVAAPVAASGTRYPARGGTTAAVTACAGGTGRAEAAASPEAARPLLHLAASPAPGVPAGGKPVSEFAPHADQKEE